MDSQALPGNQISYPELMYCGTGILPVVATSNLKSIEFA